MIYLDFSNAVIQMEATGDPHRLALVETVETPGSQSIVEYHYEGTPTSEIIREEVRVRSSGGLVSREYSLRKSGDYIITSGVRNNPFSRVFRIRIYDPKENRLVLTVRPGSPQSTWIVDDNLFYYNEGSLVLSVDLGDVTAVVNAGSPEPKRTAWDHILSDGDPV